jgi:hypothetical protein
MNEKEFFEEPDRYEKAAWGLLSAEAPPRYRRWYRTIDDMPYEDAVILYWLHGVLWKIIRRYRR